MAVGRDKVDAPSQRDDNSSPPARNNLAHFFSSYPTSHPSWTLMGGKKKIPPERGPILLSKVPSQVPSQSLCDEQYGQVSTDTSTQIKYRPSRNEEGQPEQIPPFVELVLSFHFITHLLLLPCRWGMKNFASLVGQCEATWRSIMRNAFIALWPCHGTEGFLLNPTHEAKM